MQTPTYPWKFLIKIDAVYIILFREIDNIGCKGVTVCRARRLSQNIVRSWHCRESPDSQKKKFFLAPESAANLLGCKLVSLMNTEKSGLIIVNPLMNMCKYYSINISGVHVETRSHHLLKQSRPNKEPKIGRSLRYIMKTFPSLVDEPDNEGLYHIHAALQRLRRLQNPVWRGNDPEKLVDDLLAAGVDIHACDGRGNTVLHYLAEALTERPEGDEQRGWFKLCSERGVDVNTRNNAGRMLISLLFDNDGSVYKKRAEWHVGQHDRYGDEKEKVVLMKRINHEAL